jgi:biotin carboxylase
MSASDSTALLQVESSLPEAVIVIDPYSSGRFYLYELQKRGYPIIAIRSSLEVSPYFKRAYEDHKDYFAQTIDYPMLDCSLDMLLREVHALPYKIKAVIAGSDVGVELAEHLSERMHMPTTNGTELLFQRIDKAAMQDQLRLCGIPACEQIKSGNLSELLQWATTRNKWPVVAKPAGGVGSEGIYFCKSEADIEKAHTEIIGMVNPKGVTNDSVALQEFLDGDEYIIDTISNNGKHIVVAIWTQGKRRDLPWNQTSIITTHNMLMEPSGPIQDQLVDYTFKMLDAVGFKHGPAHNEVMFTERGPVLIEINARMHGVQGPRVIELSTGVNKADYACDIFVGGCKKFDSLYKAGPSRFLYPVKKQCSQMVLCCPFKGHYSALLKEQILALKLPSVVEVLTGKSVGDFQPQSIDLPTSPGTVLMVHESMEQLEADMQSIRKAETDLDNGIYQLTKSKQESGTASQLGKHFANAGA